MESTEVSHKTLYQRLGESQGITALVDDIVEAHMRNPVIKARFLPYKERPDYLAQVKKHLCDFFASGSGGPEQYTGRDMLSAHRGMNISEAEYMAATDDILAALRKRQIDEQTQKDVLAIAYSLKGEILHV